MSILLHIDENVFRLQISMGHIVVVAVGHGG
jgi:hypothetical protein